VRITLIFGYLVAFSAPAVAAAEGAPVRRPNVLFIAVDDLRPELGCYGVNEIKTPNIDGLAAEGVTFMRAYCQQAVCNPSRASLMTGLRPDSVKVWDLRVHFRDTVPDVVTLPQHFRRHGYYAVAYGKIYHNPLPDRRSWDEPNHWPKRARVYSAASLKRLTEFRKKMRADGKSEAAIRRMRGPATEDEDVPDSRRPDGEIADQAIEALARLAKREKPFFLAVGFIRPHLPFTAPKKYWDLYRRDEIPLAENAFLPKGAPPPAMNTMYELRDYMDFADSPPPHKAPLTDQQQRRLKHGYYASVSFVDALIGRLLAKLDELKLRDDTIIVLWGDHGWKLGEHRSWCKQTNYEIDTRVPLIVRSPRMKAGGRKCPALVEFVDLYPTLCELASLPLPERLEGKSLAPLLDDPDRPFKSAAFSQFRRVHDGIEYMGHAVRTDKHRFVEWRKWRNGEVLARELYDHQNDPMENANVAKEPENRQLVEQLTKQLYEVSPPKPSGHPPGLRSKESKTRAKLFLVNELTEPVTLYWLDFHGDRRRLAVLQPGKSYTSNSFLTHPFVIESDSGRYHRIAYPASPQRRIVIKLPKSESP